MGLLNQKQYETTVETIIQDIGFEAETPDELLQFRNLIYKILLTYEKLNTIRHTGFGEQ
jgi:hypothetical protein